MSFLIFGEQCKLLPAFSKPYRDELLSSWITRMAFDHGLSTREFSSLIWPDYNGHPDIDRYIPDIRVSQLAARTNCSFEETKATTLRYYEGTLFERIHPQQPLEKWIIPSKNGAAWSSKGIYSSGLMFCPKCLRNKTYFKKRWRLAISFACPDCGCYLVESCPYCKTGNSFMDDVTSDLTTYTVSEHMVNCHHCGMDVRLYEPDKPSSRLLKLQCNLYTIIEQGYHERKISAESYFSVLHFVATFFVPGKKIGKLKIRKLIKDVFAANGLSLVKKRTERNVKQVRELPVKNRAIVILMAYWLLEKWPYRWLNHCARHNIDSNYIISSFKNVPSWFIEPMEDELFWLDEMADIEQEEEENSEKYTAGKKVKYLNGLIYDHDFDNCYYHDLQYEFDTLDENVEAYLYEMAIPCY